MIEQIPQRRRIGAGPNAVRDARADLCACRDACPSNQKIYQSHTSRPQWPPISYAKLTTGHCSLAATGKTDAQDPAGKDRSAGFPLRQHRWQQIFALKVADRDEKLIAPFLQSNLLQFNLG